jgi:hypothetical protein
MALLTDEEGKTRKILQDEYALAHFIHSCFDSTAEQRLRHPTRNSAI